MNNKRGGFGAKLLLILILMIASAIGGAYGYRVFDGKMAVRDAQKNIKSVKLSDYDTSEANQVQSYIDDATSDLNTAVTRKEVYEIMEGFNENVDKVMTRTEKELEEARRAAEEAKKNNSSNSEGSEATDSTLTGGNSDTEDSEGSGGIFNGLFGNRNSSDDTADEVTDEDDDIFN